MQKESRLDPVLPDPQWAELLPILALIHAERHGPYHPPARRAASGVAGSGLRPGGDTERPPGEIGMGGLVLSGWSADFVAAPEGQEEGSRG